MLANKTTSQQTSATFCEASLKSVHPPSTHTLKNCCLSRALLLYYHYTLLILSLITAGNYKGETLNIFYAFSFSIMSKR
jgi:hypothetical protein